jgi:GDPmannose 4,6-dehydratase
MVRRALICGVSGQDGSFLAKFLLQKGYEVHGTSRDKELASFGNLRRLNVHNEVTLHSLQPTDFRSALAVLDRVRPDEVYNLSGQSSVGLSFEQPLETFDSITAGTINLLECLRYLGCNMRFYNAASSEMFGNIEGQPADEDTAFRPTSPYAVAKAASFWAVSTYRKAYGLHACSGILFNHESPLRPTRFVTRKIIRSAAGIKNGSDETLILGNLSIVRDWGWAPEYVQAMWQMLQRDEASDFVVATGQANSLEAFTAQAFAAFGLDWRDHVRVDEALFRPSEIMYSVGNPVRAEARLGWQATMHMEDVVRLMAEGERNPDFLLSDFSGSAT